MDGNSWGDSVPPHLLRLEELHQDLSRLRQENKGDTLKIYILSIHYVHFVINIFSNYRNIRSARRITSADVEQRFRNWTISPRTASSK